MDTSKQYILMCEKAEEIQPLFKCLGDIVSWDNGRVFLVVKCYPDSVNGIRIKEWENEEEIDLASNTTILLPRQDQLQGMVGYSNYTPNKYKNPASDLIKLVIEFKLEKNKSHYFEHNSMEQLWLAFVMKEKYGKIWKGKDWEAINV